MDSIRAAMLEELGTKRLDTLPLDDRSRIKENGPVMQRPKTMKPSKATNEYASNWQKAIQSHEFDDFEAKQVQNLDPLGGPRVYAANNLPQTSFNVPHGLFQSSFNVQKAPQKMMLPIHFPPKKAKSPAKIPIFSETGPASRQTKQPKGSASVSTGDPAKRLAARVQPIQPSPMKAGIIWPGTTVPTQVASPPVDVHVPSPAMNASFIWPLTTDRPQDANLSTTVSAARPVEMTILLDKVCKVLHTPEGSCFEDGRMLLRVVGDAEYGEFELQRKKKTHRHNVLDCMAARPRELIVGMVFKEKDQMIRYILHLDSAEQSQYFCRRMTSMMTAFQVAAPNRGREADRSTTPPLSEGSSTLIAIAETITEPMVETVGSAIKESGPQPDANSVSSGPMAHVLHAAKEVTLIGATNASHPHTFPLIDFGASPSRSPAHSKRSGLSHPMTRIEGTTVSLEKSQQDIETAFGIYADGLRKPSAEPIDPRSELPSSRTGVDLSRRESIIDRDSSDFNRFTNEATSVDYDLGIPATVEAKPGQHEENSRLKVQTKRQGLGMGKISQETLDSMAKQLTDSLSETLAVLGINGIENHLDLPRFGHGLAMIMIDKLKQQFGEFRESTDEEAEKIKARLWDGVLSCSRFPQLERKREASGDKQSDVEGLSGTQKGRIVYTSQRLLDLRPKSSDGPSMPKRVEYLPSNADPMSSSMESVRLALQNFSVGVRTAHATKKSTSRVSPMSQPGYTRLPISDSDAGAGDTFTDTTVRIVRGSEGRLKEIYILPTTGTVDTTSPVLVHGLTEFIRLAATKESRVV